MSAIHCPSLGHSLLSVPTKTVNTPIPSEVDTDGSRANAKKNWAPQQPWRRQVYEHPQNEAQNEKFHKQHKVLGARANVEAEETLGRIKPNLQRFEEDPLSTASKERACFLPFPHSLGHRRPA